ncbi:hypothetical protein AGR7A_Lc120050 [Agrobacterium deltaense NCPPB 1641]|uniref:Uncharacterized protein n=1 Tax=Agrobacterium deltaense NCPPB 1641 TaxID=1183425 RepID=A0A1S7TUT1_9HYPH|nr:hypothetical protein AGR7A_Lc120050 [Agrobacterium deltaense NCPPB 1641]
MQIPGSLRSLPIKIAAWVADVKGEMDTGRTSVSPVSHVRSSFMMSHNLTVGTSQLSSLSEPEP